MNKWLIGSEIGDDGAKFIAEALKVNATLTGDVWPSLQYLLVVSLIKLVEAN